jgi:hypothetical protein
MSISNLSSASTMGPGRAKQLCTAEGHPAHQPHLRESAGPWPSAFAALTWWLMNQLTFHLMWPCMHCGQAGGFRPMQGYDQPRRLANPRPQLLLQLIFWHIFTMPAQIEGRPLLHNSQQHRAVEICFFFHGPVGTCLLSFEPSESKRAT